MGQLRVIELRSQPTTDLSDIKILDAIKNWDLCDLELNRLGKGIHHQYEIIKFKKYKLILDYTTGLMWQQSGSSKILEFELAKKYICHLNDQSYGGYNNWRMPTVEEALSLIEPIQQHDKYKNKLISSLDFSEFRTNPIFGKKQRCIWTADKYDSNSFCCVDLNAGCYPMNESDVFYDPHYVRAVRLIY